MIERKKCTGCGACKSVCHQGAITMNRDDDGFYYPEVDIKKCTHCGICETVCPAVRNITRKNEEKRTYYAYSCDETIRKNSSSGGLFSLLAQNVLQKKGVVFGAAMNDDCRTVRHISINSDDELSILRGSKYVQSNTLDTFVEVKAILNEGRSVLYSGTPCQIAGLRNFLGKEYINLITVDVICHGVPSPLAWEKYVEYRETLAEAETRRVFFRNKQYGWKTYSIRFEFTNNTEYVQILSKDLFMRGFLNNLYLRPSCYHCTFKGNNIQSDITLADFWGVENISQVLNDDKGISLVITHTKQGQQLFADIASEIKYGEVDINIALQNNQSYYESIKETGLRKAAMKDIKKLEFNTFIEKYCGSTVAAKLRRKIYSLI